MKAVFGIYEVASTDKPATRGKVQIVARRRSKLGTPGYEFHDSALGLKDDKYPSRGAFVDPHSITAELEALADEAEAAEDELNIDVIARARAFVDHWRKSPNS